jgi:glyoxylase-like metal-dependent hydrolase (beta-lactamase superfamily II)
MIKSMIEGMSRLLTTSEEIAEDIEVLQFRIVNAFLIGKKNADDWVLVDTGLENSYDYIIEKAEQRFGKDKPPKAIILTHAHFDHVGSLNELANHWPVPVYAHEFEIPFITGVWDYPEGDPTVDEGIVAKMSQFFSNEGIDIGYQAEPLPNDGTVPYMPGWRWVHTPGHTPGHVSLFRDEDRILITGDAISTTKQESLTSVVTQSEDVKGPPAYFTPDWDKAEKSVRVLKNLKPNVLLPSHGKVLKGLELTEHLDLLANHFSEQAIPNQGRYVNR